MKKKIVFILTFSLMFLDCVQATDIKTKQLMKFLFSGAYLNDFVLQEQIKREYMQQLLTEYEKGQLYIEIPKLTERLERYRKAESTLLHLIEKGKTVKELSIQTRISMRQIFEYIFRYEDNCFEFSNSIISKHIEKLNNIYAKRREPGLFQTLYEQDHIHPDVAKEWIKLSNSYRSSSLQPYLPFPYLGVILQKLDVISDFADSNLSEYQYMNQRNPHVFEILEEYKNGGLLVYFTNIESRVPTRWSMYMLTKFSYFRIPIEDFANQNRTKGWIVKGVLEKYLQNHTKVKIHSLERYIKNLNEAQNHIETIKSANLECKEKIATELGVSLKSLEEWGAWKHSLISRGILQEDRENPPDIGKTKPQKKMKLSYIIDTKKPHVFKMKHKTNKN